MKYVLFVSCALLMGCPPPQVETGRACFDDNHNTCGTCVSTRACVWCDGRCAARDPQFGRTCPSGVPTATVTEACDLLGE